jgi:hypothetical protein
MRDTTNHHNSRILINTCIDAMQDPPPICKIPKGIFNPNYTNIHLLVKHDFSKPSTTTICSLKIDCVQSC